MNSGNSSDVQWRDLVIPGLLSAVAFLAWYGIRTDINAFRQEVIEAKEMAARAMTKSHEASLMAATARPDPFTGTDGKKLREDAYNRTDAKFELLDVKTGSRMDRLHKEIENLQTQTALFNRWHEEDVLREKECLKEREEIRRELQHLRNVMEKRYE